jgi:ADP-heptose:LPS heptosyltransferase
VPPDGEAWADAWEAANGGRADIRADVRLVAIHPGAGHPAKRWGLARCLALAERLGASRGIRAAVIAGPEDRAAVDAAAVGMAAPVAVAAPPTLGALAAFLRRCRLVVAGDTGPLHLAAALGRPTVALYGPSDPVLAAPVGTGHRVIKRPCPCGWVPGPFFNRRCPDAPCMAAIEVGEVVEAVESALARD